MRSARLAVLVAMLAGCGKHYECPSDKVEQYKQCRKQRTARCEGAYDDKTMKLVMACAALDLIVGENPDEEGTKKKREWLDQHMAIYTRWVKEQDACDKRSGLRECFRRATDRMNNADDPLSKTLRLVGGP